MDIFQELKDYVNVRDVANFYGLDVNNKDFAVVLSMMRKRHQ